MEFASQGGLSKWGRREEQENAVAVDRLDAMEQGSSNWFEVSRIGELELLNHDQDESFCRMWHFPR